MIDAKIILYKPWIHLYELCGYIFCHFSNGPLVICVLICKSSFHIKESIILSYVANIFTASGLSSDYCIFLII